MEITSIINQGKIKGVTLSADFGYAFNSFATKYNDTNKYNEYIYFHSINIGLISKLNFSYWSIGIGGGVKIPLAAMGVSSKYGEPIGYPDSYIQFW